jgi:hypothetical protein
MPRTVLTPPAGGALMPDIPNWACRFPSLLRLRGCNQIARTHRIVIPAQAGIHATSSTAGSGQARSVNRHIRI